MKIILVLIIFHSCFILRSQDTIKIRKPNSEVYNLVDEQAIFPGGLLVMYQYIARNIKFPERCKTDSLFYGCKVFVKFIIGIDGYVTSPIILKGCPGFPECDKETLKVISNMPKWTPARIKNEPVNTYFNLPINFKIQ